jgi:hypothetical protein
METQPDELWRRMRTVAAVCEEIMRDALERDDVVRAIEQDGAVDIEMDRLGFKSSSEEYVLAMVNVKAPHNIPKAENGAPGVIPLDPDIDTKTNTTKMEAKRSTDLPKPVAKKQKTTPADVGQTVRDMDAPEEVLARGDYYVFQYTHRHTMQGGTEVGITGTPSIADLRKKTPKSVQVQDAEYKVEVATMLIDKYEGLIAELRKYKEAISKQ